MPVVNHIGHAVSDLQRAISFYREVLGFEEWYELSPPDEGTAKICSLPPPLSVTVYYLRLGPFVLELMHYAAPGAQAPYRPRTMNEPGLTHMSISVDDIRATAEKAVRYGGEVIEESDLGVALMIRDPDGQFIELLGADYPERRVPVA